jgi:hypothetical protein
MVRIIHTHTVHHCLRAGKGPGPCPKSKGALYCHGHSKVCERHPDTAYLKWEDCPTCTAELKLKAPREMEAGEKGKDLVGDMKKKKAEAAAAAKKKSGKP